MKLSDFINRPRSVLGAVAAAAVVTAAFLGVLALGWRLIDSHWLDDRSHSLIWMMAVVGGNALFAAIALIQKAREDNRKPPPAPSAPRRFAGPGRV